MAEPIISSVVSQAAGRSGQGCVPGPSGEGEFPRGRKSGWRWREASREASRISECCAFCATRAFIVDAVAGTSVGALIGAAYCAGTPLEEMERIGASDEFHGFRAVDAVVAGAGDQSATGKISGAADAGEKF